MSKGSQTTTTSQAPPPYVQNAYQGLISNTNQLAQTPYTPYTGEGVAPINPQQYAGIADINQYALSGVPLYQQAAGLIGGAAQPLNPTQIMNYYSPFQQNVVATTEAEMNKQNQMALNNIQGSAVAQDALGGNRDAVAQAAYYGAVGPGQAQTIAGLENTGYGQAVNLAMQQYQQNPMAAAYALGSNATGMTNTALQGAGAMTSAGTLEQGTQQALDQYLYNQYLAQQGYPFALNQYAAGIDTSVGSLAGGIGTTTGPPPNPFAQALGIGIGGLGLAGSLGWKPFAAHGGRIKGYALGGSPIMPYAGAPSYIPGAGGLAHGSGPPRPPGVPQEETSAGQMFKDAIGMANRSKTPGVGNPLDINSYTPSPIGGAAPVNYTSSDEALYQHGGRIQLPMRGGMGMPSFVRGYQEGGSPEDTDIATYNDASLPMWKRVGLSGPPSNDATTTEEALGRRYMASDVANAAYVGGPSPLLQTSQRSLPPEITGGSSGVSGGTLAYNDDGGGGLQAPSSYQPPRLPPSSRPSITPSSGGGLSPEFWQSLAAAGFGMAASRSPFLGSAIGEGALAGLRTYGGLKGKEADIEMESRKLDQQAQAESDRIAMEGRRLTEMTPYQKQELGLRQQQLEQENWAPFTDQMGNTRFFNRKTGEIRNAPPIHAPGTPTSSVTGTTGTAQVQPPETPPPTKEEQKKPLQFAGLETNNVTADDWGKDVKPAGTVTGPVNRNEAVLQDMDPNMQALVKAVADYRKDIRTLGFKDRTLVGRFVTAYDPDWSEANYNTINQTMKNFKGTGVEARNMQSQDMAVQHVGNALDNIRTLDMGNIPLINMLKTGAMEQYDPTTQAALGKLKTDIHAVGDELTRSFRGSGQPSEKEATQWMDNLDYNNPAKMRASLQEAASLLGGRIVASGSRYNDAMGERYARDPLEWMSGKGRAAYQRALSIDPIKGEGPTPQAGQAAAPTVVRSGTVNSGPNAGKRVIEYSDGHREYQ